MKDNEKIYIYQANTQMLSRPDLLPHRYYNPALSSTRQVFFRVMKPDCTTVLVSYLTFNLSVFMAAMVSASSSVICVVPPTTELDLSELGPALPSPELRRACLKVELIVGLCRVGEGLVSFSEALEA